MKQGTLRIRSMGPVAVIGNGNLRFDSKGKPVFPIVAGNKLTAPSTSMKQAKFSKTIFHSLLQPDLVTDGYKVPQHKPLLEAERIENAINYALLYPPSTLCPEALQLLATHGHLETGGGHAEQ